MPEIYRNRAPRLFSLDVVTEPLQDLVIQDKNMKGKSARQGQVILNVTEKRSFVLKGCTLQSNLEIRRTSCLLRLSFVSEM